MERPSRPWQSELLAAGGSHPYISRRDDRRADQVTQGRRCASPRRGRRRRSLTDLISPARCSLQET
ncbi:hypothetical protein CVUC_12585 [Caulobacter vibrioides]|nr:hypothetical protein CA608_20460 [Caulobacter vibrioides]PLR11076.1 hypothetical protein CVUC_12585 [Caulobacter vibrioides]